MTDVTFTCHPGCLCHGSGASLPARPTDSSAPPSINSSAPMDEVEEGGTPESSGGPIAAAGRPALDPEAAWQRLRDAGYSELELRRMAGDR